MRIIVFLILTLMISSCKKTLEDVDVRSLSGEQYVKKDFQFAPEYPDKSTINALDNTKFSAGGFFVGANTTDLCVQFTNVSGVEKDVSVKYQVDGGVSITRNGTLTVDDNSTNLCMGDDWDYKFELSNSSVGETREISMSFYVEKDDQNVLIKKFSWTIDVLPNNTVPNITSVDANGNGAFVQANNATWVSITGTGFLPAATLQFKGATCSQYVYNGPTGLDCEIPATAAGVFNFQVDNNNGQTTDTQSIQILAPPTSASNDIYKSIYGGENLTLTGTGYHSSVKVDINGTDCPVQSVANQNANSIGDTITCQLPAMSAGTYTVNIENPDGYVIQANDDIILSPRPSISTVNSNNTIYANTATNISIAGSSFQSQTNGFPQNPIVTLDNGSGAAVFTPSGATATSVTFNTGTLPAGTYTVTVTNQNDGQTSTENKTLVVLDPPTFSAVSPSVVSSSGGDTVTITGSNFINPTVSINSSPCTNLNLSNSSTLTCDVPASATGSQTILITNEDGQTDTGTIIYVNPPTMTVTMQAGLPTGSNDVLAESFTLTFNSSVSIQNFTMADISASNVTLSSFTETVTNSEWTVIATVQSSDAFSVTVPAGAFNEFNGVDNEDTAVYNGSAIHSSDLKATSLGWVETSPHEGINAKANWSIASESTYLESQSIQFYSDSGCGTTVGTSIPLTDTDDRFFYEVWGPGAHYYKITSTHTDSSSSTYNYTSNCSTVMTFQGVITALIKQNCGGTEPTSCYSGLNDWKNKVHDNTSDNPHPLVPSNKNLVTANLKLITYIEGGWTTAESANVTISGWTTNSNNHLVFKAREASRHKGHTDGPYYKLKSVTSANSVLTIGSSGQSTDTGYTVIDGVILSGAWGSGVAGLKVHAKNTEVLNTIIHDIEETSGNGHGVLVSGNGAGVQVKNSMIYDISGAGIIADAAANSTLSNVGVGIYNTTIVNACNTLSTNRAGDYGAVGTGGGGSRAYSNVQFVVFNTIAQCNIGATAATVSNSYILHSAASWGSSSKHNISDKGTAPGTNSISNIVFLDEAFRGAQPGSHIYFQSLVAGFESPLLLDHPDNIAINAGFNVSSTIPKDAQEDERLLVKKASDIGADEAGSRFVAHDLYFDEEKVLEREIGDNATATMLSMRWKKANNSNIASQTIKIWGRTDATKSEACSGTHTLNNTGSTLNNYEVNISALTHEWYFFQVETYFTDGTPGTLSPCSKPQQVIATDVIKWLPSGQCGTSLSCVEDFDDILSTSGSGLSYPGNLTTANPPRRLRVEIDGTWTSAWSSTIEIDGWTTNAKYNLTLKAVDTARHNGVLNTSQNFRVTPAINTDGVSIGDYGANSYSGDPDYVVLDGFAIVGLERGTGTSSDVTGVFVQTAHNVIKNMIIADGTKSGSGKATVHAVYIHDSNTSVDIENVISYDMPGNFFIANNTLSTNGFLSNVHVNIEHVTAYNMCTQTMTNPDTAAVGFKKSAISLGFQSSRISVRNSFLDCNNYNEFRTVNAGGTINAKQTMISGTSTAGASFSSGFTNVGIKDTGDTATSKTNNIVFEDLGANPIDLRLALNTNFTNTAVNKVYVKKNRTVDIGDNRRNHTTDIGADSLRIAATLGFQDSSNTTFFNKLELGELTANHTETIYIRNFSSANSINNVTATLVDNAGGAYSISGCNSVTLATSGTCQLDITFSYSAAGSQGMKRAILEISGEGVISESITIEAFKVPATAGAGT